MSHWFGIRPWEMHLLRDGEFRACGRFVRRSDDG